MKANIKISQFSRFLLRSEYAIQINIRKWLKLFNSVLFIKKPLVNEVCIWIWSFWLTFTVLQWMKKNSKNSQFSSFLLRSGYAILVKIWKLECYMDWFLSLICKNYIFKYFVKTIEPTSLKFCMIIELIILHLEYSIAHVKYANFSNAHAQTFVLLNGEMATVSTGFRKLKFCLWLLWTVFYLNQTGFWKIY